MKLIILLVLGFWTTFTAFSAVQVIEVDTRFPSNDNRSISLQEVNTENLPRGTVARVKGLQKRRDEAPQNWLWNGDDWQMFKGTINTKAIVFSADGQSNMAGNQAEVATYLKQDKPLDNMFQFSRGITKDGYEAGSYGKVIRAYQPLQFPHTKWFAPSSKELSLAFYFARAYAQDHPDTDVYLVCGAIGATGFNSRTWGSGDYARVRSNEEATKLIAGLEGYYQIVSYGGSLWHQGEDDAQTAFVPFYAEELKQSFEFARSEIGVGDFPIVLGTMVSSWIGTNSVKLQIDAAHRDFPNQLPNVALADLSSLTDKGIDDGLHFGQESLRVAGQIYYDAWKTLEVVEEPEPAFQVFAQGSRLVSTGEKWGSESSVPDVVEDDVSYLSFHGHHSLHFDQAMPSGPFTKVIVVKFNSSSNTILMSSFIGEASSSLSLTEADAREPHDLGAITSSERGEISFIGRGDTDGIEANIYALTYDDESKLRLYVNGQLIDERTHLKGTEARRARVSIGASGNTDLGAEVYYAALFEGVISTEKMNSLKKRYSPSKSESVSFLPAVALSMSLVAAGFVRKLIIGLFQATGVSTFRGDSRLASAFAGILVFASIIIIMAFFVIKALKVEVISNVAVRLAPFYFNVFSSLVVLGIGLLVARYFYGFLVRKNAILAQIIQGMIVITSIIIIALNYSGVNLGITGL